MGRNESDTLRLKRPTDFDILEVLSDGERDVGVNIAAKLDRDRGYINTRLPDLADYGLVRRVGPSERSGLYVITSEGVAALELRGRYGEDDFETLVEERAASITIHRPRVTDESGE